MAVTGPFYFLYYQAVPWGSSTEGIKKKNNNNNNNNKNNKNQSFVETFEEPD